MRTALIAFIAIFSLSATAADLNVKKGLALEGYDPVSYFANGPVEGKKSITATHQGATYRFATSANRDKFKAAPDKYAPAYGGWCAWAVYEGSLYKVDPKAYRIADGRLLLFYKGFLGNTLKKWNDTAKSGSESKMLAKADANWKKL